MRRAVLSVCSILAVAPAAALAQAPPTDAPVTPGATAGSIWDRPNLAGNLGGLRDRLAAQGIGIGAVETSEVLGNVSGGLRRGTAYDGRTQVDLSLDLGRLLGWDGGRVHVNAYQIHGNGLTSNLNNYFTVSSIEAKRSTRLNDFYLDQDLFGGKLSVRVGQFAADEEFFVSSVSPVLVNSTFGWPAMQAFDLLGGGPAYPLATPGVRLKVQPTPSWLFQAGLFNGSPGGPVTGDAQTVNPSGTNFPIGQGVFAIAEAAHIVAPDKDAPGLPADYKIGAWYESLGYNDLHLDGAGRSLVDPASNGLPRRHRGNLGVYAVFDQMLYRKPGTADEGLALFAHAATTPLQDRSQLYVYADAGLTYKGLPGRAQDIVGIGVAVASLSHSLRALDHDAIGFTGIDQPVRSQEAVIELTYQVALLPWLTVQPDFQYIIHPGGKVPDPTNPLRAVPDAAVFGLRTNVTF